MKRKELKTKPTSLLALRKETLRQLEAPQLQGVAGGGRLRVPGGRYDDTTPIWIEIEDPG